MGSELLAIKDFLDQLNINVNFMVIILGSEILIDFITGIAKGYKIEEAVSSSKLRNGGFKKAGIALVVLLSFELSQLFNDKHLLIYNCTLIYYIYAELVSIIENLNALGVKLPPILLKIIQHVESISKHTKQDYEDEGSI